MVIQLEFTSLITESWFGYSYGDRVAAQPKAEVRRVMINEKYPEAILV